MATFSFLDSPSVSGESGESDEQRKRRERVQSSSAAVDNPSTTVVSQPVSSVGIPSSARTDDSGPIKTATVDRLSDVQSPAYNTLKPGEGFVVAERPPLTLNSAPTVQVNSAPTVQGPPSFTKPLDVSGALDYLSRVRSQMKVNPLQDLLNKERGAYNSYNVWGSY